MNHEYCICMPLHCFPLCITASCVCVCMPHHWVLRESVHVCVRARMLAHISLSPGGVHTSLISMGYEWARVGFCVCMCHLIWCLCILLLHCLCHCLLYAQFTSLHSTCAHSNGQSLFLPCDFLDNFGSSFHVVLLQQDYFWRQREEL